MQVEILVVSDCPHELASLNLLRQALDDIGLGHVRPAVRVMSSQTIAAAEGFTGSPTFAVNGRDVFPRASAPAALACRLYDGPDGLPDLRDLRQALKRAAAQAIAQ